MDIFESNFKVLRIIYYINLVLSLLYIVNYGITLGSLVFVLLVFFFMNPLGIAVSYHRYWSHKSFEFRNRFFMYMCTIPPLISGVGSILGWVGLHRRHHKFSDKEDDPHRASKGFFNMLSMRTYDYKPNPREVVDLMRDPFIVNTHRYYFLFPLVYALVCFVLFGFSGLVIGYCMPAALSLITQNTTNYVNHFNYGDEFKPANVLWINILNFGDGWHKNHHDDPTSYTTQQQWWQLDPAGWMIKYVLAKSVKVANV